MDNNTQCVILVLLEMGLSFSGIVCNLLVVTTLRQDETLKASTMNFLLLNLCFSNLLISFLVKPISAIYVGYAISTGEWQVGLAFCTLYTFTYRTTWCVFPFSLVAMCWVKLLAQCKCGLCGLLCCSRGARLRRGEGGLEEDGGNELGLTRESSPCPQSSVNNVGVKVTEQSSNFAPITEYTLQYRPNRQFTSSSLLLFSGTQGSLMAYNNPESNRSSTNLGGSARGDSISTPTPSTTTEANQAGNNCNNPLLMEEEPGNGSAGGGQGNVVIVTAGDAGFGTSGRRRHVRTIEDGPTARQKGLVALIWIGSAFFGVTTCFPDKVFGIEMSQKILEDQLRTIAPSLGTPRNLDLTYCTVKTGVNDILDYIALVVALILPFIVGPCLVGFFQVSNKKEKKVIRSSTRTETFPSL